MKALCWHGKGDVRVDTVPDPKIEDPRDAIVRITSTRHLRLRPAPATTATCRRWRRATSSATSRWARSSRRSAAASRSSRRATASSSRSPSPAATAGSASRSCSRCCDTTNPNAEMARKAMGQSPAGLFGYSHMLGGFAGGQAEYLRVPFADVGPIKIDPTACPTRRCCSSPTSSRPATWPPRTPRSSRATRSRSGAAGRSAQFAIQSAWMLGAGRVIAIDRVPERLEMAESTARPRRSTSTRTNVYDALQEMTKGRGPDRCIDAVGCEAHAGGSVDAVLDKAKAAVDAGHRPGARPARGDHVLPQGRHDLGPRRLRRLPGQDPVRRRDEQGPDHQDGPDPRPALHRAAAARRSRPARSTRRSSSPTACRSTDAPEAYKTFRDKKDGCIKVVLKP